MPHGTAGGPLLWFNVLAPERLGLESMGFLWGVVGLLRRCSVEPIDLV